MKRLFPTRQYRSGSAYALWRWSDVPQGNIVRLHLLQCPKGAVHLHWFTKPDPEPFLHDHPTTFLSILLHGWYDERRVVDQTNREGRFILFPGFVQRVKWWNFFRASDYDRHTIVRVAPGGAVSITFMGPKRREWGYHTDEGWVWWKVYNKERYGK